MDSFAFSVIVDTQLLVMVAVQLTAAIYLLRNACLLDLMDGAKNAKQVSLLIQKQDAVFQNVHLLQIIYKWFTPLMDCVINAKKAT